MRQPSPKKDIAPFALLVIEKFATPSQDWPMGQELPIACMTARVDAGHSAFQDAAPHLNMLAECCASAASATETFICDEVGMPALCADLGLPSSVTWSVTLSESASAWIPVWNALLLDDEDWGPAWPEGRALAPEASQEWGEALRELAQAQLLAAGLRREGDLCRLEVSQLSFVERGFGGKSPEWRAFVHEIQAREDAGHIAEAAAAGAENGSQSAMGSPEPGQPLKTAPKSRRI